MKYSELQIQKDMQEDVLCGNDEEFVTDGVEDEASILEPEVTLLENNEFPGESTLSSTSSTPVSFGHRKSSDQPKISSFTINSKRSTKLDRCLGYFVAVDMQPYNIVENDGFKHLIQTMQPGYVLPSRKTLIEVIIPKMYDTTKLKIKSYIDSASYISFTTDAWTYVASKPFILLTAHLINNDWAIQSAVLNCREMSEDHTAENVCDALKDLLQEWDIPEQKVVGFTTDSGANIVKAINLMKINRVSCFGHTINTPVTKIMDSPDLETIITKIQFAR
ncbi:unnamed protein product [Phaedon cochleariae]|uniref:Uncharacterized protein n=1 Tax=Phaedon cochleariae TaxID=80249 RepID=A0A9N9X2N3_PHACE|nr:unnamed protein product [Phaedon cochleariae]